MGHRMRKHREIMFERILMRGLTHRRRAVFQRDHIISKFVGGTHRRFDATISQEAGQSHGPDLPITQDKVQIGRTKSVETELPLDEDVFWLRLERASAFPS